jgi:hypothetical protein
MKAFALLALAGCAAADFEERPLATLPEVANVVVPVAFSRDGRHAAYVLRSPDGDRAARGERSGQPFEVI